jgi:cytochrome P450
VTASPTDPAQQQDRTPLYGPEFAADPGAVYRMLRANGTTAPVDLAPGVPATLVLGYSAALDVLRNPSTFPKDPRRWQAGLPADCPVLPMMGYRPNCLFTDGTVHSRLRGAVTDSFARVDVNSLREYVAHSADEIIDKLRPVGKADLLNDYAKMLPLLVFNRLFGCPPEVGDRLVAGMSGIFQAGADAEKWNDLLTAALVELVTLKRREPGEDMVTWLLTHPAKLTEEEMVHQIAVLLGAGTEPEQNLIANGLRLLLSDDRFAGDLTGGNLPVEDALDEVLWNDPPMANYAATYPLQDLDFAGVRLPEAQPVVISFAAANTDPALASQQRAGNRAHLAWSAGPHACPAQGQARLIATVAIEKILDGLPDMELDVPVDQLVWRPGPFHRALAALPVRFTPSDLPVELSETPGDNSWHPIPTPMSSTPPAATSTARQPTSVTTAPSRWWNFLARWWRGR